MTPSHAVHPTNPSQVVVLVNYRLGRQVLHDSVGLTQTSSGRQRHWWINAPPCRPLLLHSPHVAHATVAAATVPTTTDRTGGSRASNASSLWALPGIYTITAVPDRLYDAEPLTLTVGGPAEQTTITPPVRIKPSALDEVHRQVNDHIDGCAAQDTLSPRNPGPSTTYGCPFRAPDRFTITRHVHWTIATYPKLALAVSDAGPVHVTTTTHGEADVSYEWTTDIVEPRR